MLAAYYSKGCNSEEMFSGLDISRESDFKTHLNKYDVIPVSYTHLDVYKRQGFQSEDSSTCILYKRNAGSRRPEQYQ